MLYKTESCLSVIKKESVIDRTICKFIHDEIKTLTLKEDYFMLEKLYEKREQYILKRDAVKDRDIDLIVDEEVNKVREQIKEEVLAKYEADLSAADLKIVVIDEIIADEEAKQELDVEEVQEEQPENQVEE